ncbi:MAG TPA: hypothetical protein VM328_03090 [Fimbriimonadaceae bacterium]|nr:hypothetical protein [Fimbriimonadaceae bacterium]
MDEEDAARYVEDLARKLGVPEELTMAGFGCVRMGGRSDGSLVCGATFIDSVGAQIASIRVDLFDGGLHSFEFQPWKLERRANARGD